MATPTTTIRQRTAIELGPFQHFYNKPNTRSRKENEIIWQLQKVY